MPDVIALFFCFALLFLNSCKLTYPHCDSDSQCSSRQQICWQGTCQECRDNSQCNSKYPNQRYRCQLGRCELEEECNLDSDCLPLGKDLLCRQHRCQEECHIDSDCPLHQRCFKAHCYLGCKQDDECGQGFFCSPDAICRVSRDLESSGNNNNNCWHEEGGRIQSSPLQAINFEFDSFELSTESRSLLDKVLQCLKQRPATVDIIIEGHCDDRGTQEYNLALGEKRARAVLQYIKTMGIQTSGLSVRSKGENEPLCNESSDACRSQNRRVQFVLAAQISSTLPPTTTPEQP